VDTAGYRICFEGLEGVAWRMNEGRVSWEEGEEEGEE